MDLMGVLEPPVENTTCTASVRRQGVTYLVARMVPAALSVVIGWLYVDAFVLKGANLARSRRFTIKVPDPAFSRSHRVQKSTPSVKSESEKLQSQKEAHVSTSRITCLRL